MNTTLAPSLMSHSFAPAPSRGFLPAAPARPAHSTPARPAAGTAADTTAPLVRSIALPAPRTTRLERLLVAALTLAAATALVQGLSVMLRFAPPWDGFSAWVANILL